MSSRRRTQLAATVLALGLLATACGSDGSGADTASTATVPPAATQPGSTSPTDDAAASSAAPTSPDAPDTSTATPVAVPEALQFTAPLVGGGEFTGADYAGKPTVFWFWAPT